MLPAARQDDLAVALNRDGGSERVGMTVIDDLDAARAEARVKTAAGREGAQPPGRVLSPFGSVNGTEPAATIRPPGPIATPLATAPPPSPDATAGVPPWKELSGVQFGLNRWTNMPPLAPATIACPSAWIATARA